MESFTGPCPHQSVPVEMDESMTSSSLIMALPPPCQQCSGRSEQRPRQQREHGYEQTRRTEVSQRRPPGGGYYCEPSVASHVAPQQHFMHQMHPAAVWPGGLRGQVPRYDQDYMVRDGGPSLYRQNSPVEEEESLERPLPLVSDANCVSSQQSAKQMPGHTPMQATFRRPCACCPPENLPRHNNNHHHGNHRNPEYPHQEPRQQLQSQNIREPLNAPQRSFLQCGAPSCDLIQEVSVGRPIQAGPGPATREMKMTINLPDECRNVFITYSVDTAREMLSFVKFLRDQGFIPMIDLLDNPVRRMDINSWMDRCLNDKSVLIIVIISPKYQQDVEGDGIDEHGLNTKYIHNQIQNEFIQQGCRNFRLVPVLFPNATKDHVPKWLRSTRIYRWPHDVQDLLLRLLREERYIIAPPAGDLTLTIRTL